MGRDRVKYSSWWERRKKKTTPRRPSKGGGQPQERLRTQMSRGSVTVQSGKAKASTQGGTEVRAVSRRGQLLRGEHWVWAGARGLTRWLRVRVGSWTAGLELGSGAGTEAREVPEEGRRLRGGRPAGSGPPAAVVGPPRAHPTLG